MKNNRKSINQTQAVILFMMLTVTLHILGLKANGVIKESELISAYLDYGSKILGAILIAEMLLFIWLTPMKLNRQALRWYGKEDGKALMQIISQQGKERTPVAEAGRVIEMLPEMQEKKEEE